jgi:Protein of unknown function (DUF3572)
MNRARPPGLDAETIAIRALAFLAGDLERLERFLALTGLSPDGVRAAAGDPGFVLAVLEHITGDETLLMTFSANAGLSPEAVEGARLALEAQGRGTARSAQDDYGW